MDKDRRVRDIYHKGVILCKPDSPLQEVVKVMADTEIHAVMVTEHEGQPPVGVVSHIDVIAHYGEDLTATVISISEDATVGEAAEKLLESNIHRLLVVNEEGRPVGILSTTDIIREIRGTRWVWYLD
jgi:predicted transcriptional regulator